MNDRGPPEPVAGRWRRGGRSKTGSRLEGVLATTLTRFCGANRRGRRAAEVTRDRQGEPGSLLSRARGGAGGSRCCGRCPSKKSGGFRLRKKQPVRLGQAPRTS